MKVENIDSITSLDQGDYITVNTIDDTGNMKIATHQNLIEKSVDTNEALTVVQKPQQAKAIYKSHWPVLRTLRKERLKRHIRQKDIADYLGITVQYYSQIERGINTLSYSNALQIAAWFGTTTDELFEKDYLQSDILMESIAEERMKKYKKKEK